MSSSAFGAFYSLRNDLSLLSFGSLRALCNLMSPFGICARRRDGVSQLPASLDVSVGISIQSSPTDPLENTSFLRNTRLAHLNHFFCNLVLPMWSMSAIGMHYCIRHGSSHKAHTKRTYIQLPREVDSGQF